MNFEITSRTALIVEPEGFEGVRRVAGLVAGDIEAVTGFRPAVSAVPEGGEPCILCATLGRSPICAGLAEAGILNAEYLRAHREVYQIVFAELSGCPALVICGGDKRGTIYGMFSLSEYLGVSPLCRFGDAAPRKQEHPVIFRDIETISREPSVKYRGFFINDEWPCFGSWATAHFGGVNAACYEMIFEFLLRMRGNYLWPAMWHSSFPLDGPGGASEELADLYGVIMGYSHHEPCLRASEEWDLVRGPETAYGNEWNYYTNEPGLIRYWTDALKRSGKFENIVTIGMRGERDTSMLGEDATLEENISLLKRIITKQRELIRQYGNPDAPQLLALYKEVERYFHGDETAEGLKSWRELDDVLFLLCEDNYNYLRTVPPAQLRDHPGGWGMYYHFDYHGSPISYEWVDSTPLSVCREQMSQAWEYGIRDLWIVNVGDIKFHEVSLAYFLALAYDYDRWSSPDSAARFTAAWAERTFPQASPEQQACIADVFRDYIALNGMRRPEALHPGIYHPCHYGETDRLLAFADSIEQRSGQLLQSLPEDARDGYYSMVHYPAAASANLAKLHLYAGKNAHYANQGKVIANRYAGLAEECIARDRALAEAFGAFRGGKWDGMQHEAHIGFTRWNEDDCRYPVLQRVIPFPYSMMKVSRADREQVFTKVYGPPAVIPVEDFRSAGVESVTLEIANGGNVPFTFTVIPADTLPEWLTVTPESGTVEEQTLVTLRCDRSRLSSREETCRLRITDGCAVVEVEVRGMAVDSDALPGMTFLPRNGVVSILAEHYAQKTDVPGAVFTRLGGYGKFGSGMKVAPSTAGFENGEPAPSLTYSFLAEETGDYTAEILTAPCNPIAIGSPVLLRVNGRTAELVPPDYRAGEASDPRWASAVLNRCHSVKVPLEFSAGIQTLTIEAVSPGVVPEKILIYRDAPLPSYLGPEESPCAAPIPIPMPDPDNRYSSCRYSMHLRES